jgi:hypothetical protein
MVPDLFLCWVLNILILGLFRISSLPTCPSGTARPARARSLRPGVSDRPEIRILTVPLLPLQGKCSIAKTTDRIYEIPDYIRPMGDLAGHVGGSRSSRKNWEWASIGKGKAGAGG